MFLTRNTTRTIVPLEDDIAMIGLVEKFNSPLAVTYNFDGTCKPEVCVKLQSVELMLSDCHISEK